jgi:DNA-binding IclR family transcriptional regulator
VTAPRHSLRALIQACIDASPTYLTAQEVSQRTGIPYKATIDVLHALHNRDCIVRDGRKFSARWGSRRLRQAAAAAPSGWTLLAAAWFGEVLRL